MLEPLTNSFLITILVVLLLIVVASDLLTHRIANRHVVFGLLAALIGQTWMSGATGFAIGFAGACVGLLCLLPFYISGGMGAGDVKLMAMCGAFLGPVHVVVASAASLIIGGALGVGWFFYWQFSAGEDNPQATLPPIPYALAIGAGVLISIVAAPIVGPTLAKGNF